MSLRIDHHVHLGSDKKYRYTLEPPDLLNLMNQFGIDKSIVFSCPFQKFDDNNPYFNSNRYIRDSSLLFINRLIPFMFVHPFLDTKEEVESIANEFYGFKLYCQAGDYDYRRLGLSDIADYIFGQRKPVIFHISRTEESRPSSLIDVVDSFPETPFYFTHCGRLFNQDLETLSSRNNVYIDIAPLATMCSDSRFFATEENRSHEIDIRNPVSILRYLCKIFGRDRILWGSDAPWSNNMLPNGYAQEIEILTKIEELK